MPRQKTLGLEDSKHKEATQKQDGNAHFPIASSNRRDHHDKPTKRHALTTALKAAAHTHQNAPQKPLVSTESPQNQNQQDATSHEAPLETHTKRTDDDNPTPTDPITSKRTLDFIEDLLTPLQTVPMDISYNIVENACDSRAAPDDWLLPTSREEQKIFDEWLVPMTPEEEASG